MTSVRSSAPPISAPSEQPRVVGAAIVYRLFDVGYEVHLDRVLDLLAASAPERVRPVRGEAQAIHIPNPPITVILGTEEMVVGWRPVQAEVSARIFDFGVISLRARIPAPNEMSWSEFSAFGQEVNAATAGSPVFDHHLQLLTARIAGAIARARVAAVTEDYIVYRIDRLTGPDGRTLDGEALRDMDVAPLLLNETRPLSPDARRELLPHRFSYYPDDLAILTWDNALTLEPNPADADVQYMLEFANAQLLELRYYDAVLDAELPKMYDRIEGARLGTGGLLRRRYAPLLGDLQRLVADSTELIERAENSLKVTDDVYLARIYATALEIFRARAWRTGVDRKLAIIRDTYSMLNGEAQAARAEVLELAIVLLIVADIVIALLIK